MLRAEDIQMEIGRASHGGDFLRLTHIPSGISRLHPGPLGTGSKQHVLISAWLSEIEDELLAKGLTQYIVPTIESNAMDQKQFASSLRRIYHLP